MEIKNAQIKSTMLGREDHGIMTFMIAIEWDGCVNCGIGGYAIDQYNRQTGIRTFSAKGLEAISKVLDVVGVDSWEKLPGKYVRIKYEGWNKPIVEIGNLMKDKWFNLKDFFAS